jgi:hypothetical protein
VSPNENEGESENERESEGENQQRHACKIDAFERCGGAKSLKGNKAEMKELAS